MAPSAKYVHPADFDFPRSNHNYANGMHQARARAGMGLGSEMFLDCANRLYEVHKNDVTTC